MTDCLECGSMLWADRAIQIFHIPMNGEPIPTGYAHAWHYTNPEADDA